MKEYTIVITQGKARVPGGQEREWGGETGEIPEPMELYCEKSKLKSKETDKIQSCENAAD